MKRILVLFSLLFFSACVQPSVKTQPRPDQLNFPPLHFTFPQVVKTELKNGIKLYLKEDHELPLVALTVMIPGGSIYDPPGKTGLSQLFANALETGGAGDLSPAELAAALEGMAAELNVSSSTYAYQIDLSLHKRDLEKCLRILSDLLRRPRFDPERLELSRRQMLDGIRRENDDPGSIAGRSLDEAIFPGHPFGASPKVAAVEQMNRADLLDLYQRYFHPNGLWLAVSGDVERAELISLLEQNFAGWQAAATQVPVPPVLPAPPAGKILLADKDIPQTTILMGHQGIDKDNPDMYALQVANYILGGGGFNSRLMREIRSNRGLAYSVYSYFQIGRRLPGVFIAGSETKTASTGEVVALMRQQIEQLIDQPVAAAELELAKRSLINSFIFAFENTHDIVSRRLRLDFYQYPADYMERYQQRIDAVTVSDVQRVARRYLHPGQLQVVLVGQQEQILEQIQGIGLPISELSYDPVE